MNAQEAIQTAREQFAIAEDSYYFELRRLEWLQYPKPLTRYQKDAAWEKYGLDAWKNTLIAEKGDRS